MNNRFLDPMEYAVLELTNRCNLRCPHCASNSGPPRENELSKEEWFNVIKEMKSLGMLEITIIGGEVFLNKDWFEIAKFINSIGIKLVIITNGTIVSDEIYKQITELDIEIYGISLDGASNAAVQKVRGIKTGFDKAWGLIQRLVDDGYDNVNAITTFSKLNYDDFDNLANLMENSDVTWQIQFANSVSKRFSNKSVLTLEQYKTICDRISEILLEKQDSFALAPMDDFGYYPFETKLNAYHHDWYGCQGGLSVIGIRANGDLLPCLSMGDDFVVCNLREVSLTEAWQSDSYFSTFRTKHENLQGYCLTCPKSEKCRAGCPSMAFTSTGDIYDNKYCLRRIEADEILDELNDIKDLE
jgi:radical SAM protein with 4Fe4S-binding SPASM domain